MVSVHFCVLIFLWAVTRVMLSCFISRVLDINCSVVFCKYNFFRIILLNLPAAVFFIFLTCMAGLTVFAYFAKSGCDPLANRDIYNPNQVCKRPK